MRWSILLLVCLIPAAHAGFGAGSLDFADELLPFAWEATEPTMGIDWMSQTAYYMAGTNVARADLHGDPLEWVDVSPANMGPFLDSFLHVEPDTGRMWAGGSVW